MRLPRRALVVGALVVAGLGWAVLALVDDGDDGPRSKGVRLPTPVSITRDGVRYRAELTTPSAIVPDPKDPRVLTVYSLALEQPERPSCAWLEPRARVESESADVVRVATFSYTARRPSSEKVCAFRTAGDGSTLFRELRVVLAEPLGSRRVIDQNSGDEMAALDPSFAPTPAYVPSGFRQTLVTHFVPRDSFVALRQYASPASSSSLEIRVRAAAGWTPSGTVLSRSRVGEAPATVTDEDYERCVSWSPRRAFVAEACALPGDAVSSQELLRIARSVGPVP